MLKLINRQKNLVRHYKIMLYSNRVIKLHKDNFIKTQENFRYSFEGENEISAQALTDSISIIIDSLKGITSNYKPEAYFKLNIRALKEGSVDVNMSAIIETARNLATPENFNLSMSVINTFTGMIKLKKFLKGHSPAKSEKNTDKTTKVYNIEGNVTIIDNGTFNTYMNDQRYDKNISNLTTIAQNNDRDSVKIEFDNESISIEKSDYQNMTKKIIESRDNQILTNILQTDLLLRKPDLAGNSKWGFILNKNIDVAIEDYDFLDRVRNRKIRTLYNGVRVPCKLRIDIDLDQKGSPIEGSEQYTIIEVTGMIKEPEDSSDKQIRF